MLPYHTWMRSLLRLSFFMLFVVLLALLVDAFYIGGVLVPFLVTRINDHQGVPAQVVQPSLAVRLFFQIRLLSTLGLTFFSLLLEMLLFWALLQLYRKIRALNTF